MRYVVGIDIGGTNLVVGCVAEDGSALHGLMSEPTQPESGADDVMERLLTLARRSIAETRARLPERGDRRRGRRRTRPARPPTAASCCSRPTSAGPTCRSGPDVRDGLDLHAALDNDANCAVLGEWWIGAAKGARHAVGITIGTGIGGGLIVERRDGARRVRLCRRDRARHDRDRGTPLQVRQLRLPRGVRLGSRHRAPRRGGGGVGRGEPAWPSSPAASLLDVTAQTVYEAANHGDVVALAGGERDRQVPRHRHREPGQRAESRGGRGVRWRDARGRRPLRAAPARGGAPRLPSRGGSVPHRPRRCSPAPPACTAPRARSWWRARVKAGRRGSGQ